MKNVPLEAVRGGGMENVPLKAVREGMEDVPLNLLGRHEDVPLEVRDMEDVPLEAVREAWRMYH